MVDWKKTLTKMAYVAVEVLLAGGLAYVTGRPELIFLAPVIEGMLDYWKHRNDGVGKETVTVKVAAKR